MPYQISTFQAADCALCQTQMSESDHDGMAMRAPVSGPRTTEGDNVLVLTSLGSSISFLRRHRFAVSSRHTAVNKFNRYGKFQSVRNLPLQLDAHQLNLRGLFRDHLRCCIVPICII